MAGAATAQGLQRSSLLTLIRCTAEVCHITRATLVLRRCHTDMLSRLLETSAEASGSIAREAAYQHRSGAGRTFSLR